MRRFGTFCLLFALAAPAFATPVPPAEEPPAEEQSIPWYRWLFLGERAKPKKPETTAAKPTTTREKPPAPPTKEALAKTLADEQKVYLQRLDAITKIRSIAADQNDEAMLQKADELEKQATEIYNQRTARLMAAGERADDRAALERGKDDRPATADRSNPRRRTTGGMDR
ncbi:MAG TPA: hypothetical protein VHR66_13395 [Gemmataceae bacterium]|jgi:hypothetical protein|nr:hypothetical protein [Gemmataceae bacterium]